MHSLHLCFRCSLCMKYFETETLPTFLEWLLFHLNYQAIPMTFITLFYAYYYKTRARHKIHFNPLFCTLVT